MDIKPHKKHQPSAHKQEPDHQAPARREPPDEAASVTPVGGRAKSVLSTAWLFLGALIIAVLLNTFVIQSYQVDGQSMQDTLHDGDRLIVDKVPRTIARIDGHQYVPNRGDIIIFNQQGLPGFSGVKQLIKRVVGLPGDRVVVADGHIMIYNDKHPDGFNPDTTGDYHIDQPTGLSYDGVLKSDELFVCGDNRGNSEDSRSFGPIKTDQIVAKLVLRILPLDKARGF